MTCLKLKSTAKACKCTIRNISEPFLLPLHADLTPLPRGILIIVIKRPELFGDHSRGRGVLRQLLQATAPSQQQPYKENWERSWEKASW